jgi:hypothetical protein
MTWQPIETAPKDERYILAYFGNSKKWPLAIAIAYQPSGCGSYRDASDDVYFSTKPTHWMPLPEKPSRDTSHD